MSRADGHAHRGRQEEQATGAASVETGEKDLDNGVATISQIPLTIPLIVHFQQV